VTTTITMGAMMMTTMTGKMMIATISSPMKPLIS
jgi:hypothetical protein